MFLSMNYLVSLAITTIVLVPSNVVNAHGIVSSIAVQGGKTFTSPLIGQTSQSPGPFYIPDDNSPVTSTKSNTMLCGRVTSATADSLPTLKAGDTLAYSWISGFPNQGLKWPHTFGPMSWYMTECDGDKGCGDEATRGGGSTFVKLAENGFLADNSDWTQSLLHKGKPVPFTIPANLKAGTYLIRHEVINLAIVPFEIYPACAQFKITGSGSQTLSAVAAAAAAGGVKFPGAYGDDHPGLTVSGLSPVFDDIKSDEDYSFPGPKVVQLGGKVSVSGAAGDDGSSSDAGSDSEDEDEDECEEEETTSVTSVAATATTTTDAPESTTTTTTGSDSDTSSTDTTTPATNNLSVCVTGWDTCNAAWIAANGTNNNYTCQQDYVDCVSGTTTNTENAKRGLGLRKGMLRMHKTRREFSLH